MKQRINQKGIVLSGLIYALLVFYLLLLVSLLTILWYRQSALNKLKDQADNVYEHETLAPDYDSVKGVNRPKLASGMTPIKWNGSAWVDTIETDTDWYNYTVGDKKWANARTKDGSIWVWVPRFVYSISSNWHSTTTGTIDVQFSMGTDDTRGGTITLDTGATSNASNNKWTNHPAFKFGTVDLTGFWMAKFEASGTTSSIDILPNVTSLRNVSVSDIFVATRNMEKNNKYGWGTSGTGIDTHLSKNSEWGAVAYLSQSTYGKNAKVWANPSSDYITGCAGDNVLAPASSGCPYTYNTTNGGQTSTTGNIYGIFDTTGCAWDMVAGYANNAYADDNGLLLYNADAKYKDVYAITTGTQASNYANAINKKGDAVYETSSSEVGSTTWYSGYSNMPFDTGPWFMRGDLYSNSPNGYASPFRFSYFGGLARPDVSFHPVLIVSNNIAIDEDNNPPVISMNGNSPVYVLQGSTYSDAGATAFDFEDGNMTSSIVSTGTVNINTVGTYYINYNVTDSDGNAANQVTRTVNVVAALTAFSYTGNYQTFTAPLSGTYKIELWGGASQDNNSNYLAKGAYTTGNIVLSQNEKIYVYVGERGAWQCNKLSFNGGGKAATAGGCGAGASDVRLTLGNWDDVLSLRSRIMVAGGGGGWDSTAVYGHGGGLSGINSQNGDGTTVVYGGTQTAGGTSAPISMPTGGFGYGANDEICTTDCGAGGGGGYYGGGGAAYWGNGGGGSSFISGYTGCNAVNASGTSTGQPNHYSGKVFTSSQMIAGNASMPAPGGGSETGHSGDGYAKITFLNP